MTSDHLQAAFGHVAALSDGGQVRSLFAACRAFALRHDPA
jgi:hypothetical protein